MMTPVELRNGMVVDGNLDLTGRRDLVRLPDNLTVNGNLSCNSCINLRELPSGLTVRGNLSLRGCKNLKAMAPVTVLGKIFIDGNLILRTPSEYLPMLLGMNFYTAPALVPIDTLIERCLRGEYKESKL